MTTAAGPAAIYPADPKFFNLEEVEASAYCSLREVHFIEPSASLAAAAGKREAAHPGGTNGHAAHGSSRWGARSCQGRGSGWLSYGELFGVASFEHSPAPWFKQIL